MNKNAIAQPMAVPATHVLVIHAPATDVIVNQTTTSLALATLVRVTKRVPL